MIKRIQWKSLILGAATFLAIHVVVASKWATWFDGQHEPWFLNSGRAVGFTGLCLLVAGLVASACWARRRDDVMAHGATVAAGAVLAMTVVLIAAGPGTIFPIVIVFGGMVVLFSSAIGALIVWPFKPH
jgi:hypothetical protein